MFFRTSIVPPVAAVASLAMSGSALAQGITIVPNGSTKAATQGDEDGVPVEMFENPNLDRFLRRAQEFLGREDYPQAIKLMQAVVEGKTAEVVGEVDGGAPPAVAPAPPPAPPTTTPSPFTAPRRVGDGAGTTPAPAAPPPPLDARQAVFSIDGRLYRPVRRLCHESLARLPAIGIDLYRAEYEPAANEMLERALQSGATSDLEAVANRYFVTLSAGRAMALLADRLMHEGRYRAAVQVLRDLVDVYPAINRKQLGISDAWCGFKMALCLRLGGDPGAAHELAAQLATRFADETLRIVGELQAVKDLPTNALFANDVARIDRASRDGNEPNWLSTSTDELIPLWQYRFKVADPYRDPKAGNDDNRVRGIALDEGGASLQMPFAGRYGGGAWLTFSDARPTPEALFLEHFRLRVADTFTGVVTAATEGLDEPPAPRENHPRIRIAASDFALLRPVEDEARRYVVLGHPSPKSISSIDALRASELVAYSRDTLQRLWSSDDSRSTDDGFRDVTFLAAPTVFGDRLLLPSVRRGSYALECVHRTTGRSLWRTPLHAGGSAFWKAPGVPVVVNGGIAFVATNAGCVAAVDAFSGDLRWIRRYERTDPLRAPKRTGSNRTRAEMQFGAFFQQAELPRFEPNDLLVLNGVVIVAACDSDLLTCLDGASGRPLWFVDGASRFAPFGKLRALVGIEGNDLFVTSDRHLVCIAVDGGLVKWMRELPASPGKNPTRGRGVVVAGSVVLPFERELLVFDAAGKESMRRVALPAFDRGHEPLSGACTLVAHGPWLGVGHAGGVEVYSSRTALRGVAATTSDALRKAMLLVQAGDRADAESTLTAAVVAENDAARRHRLFEQLLSIAGDRATAATKPGDAAAGLATLDPILPLATDRDSRLHWHLARLEMCKNIGDLRAHEREQQRLYDFMEGRG